jgi:hypothetical protein
MKLQISQLLCLSISILSAGCATHTENRKQVVAVEYVACDNHLLDGTPVDGGRVQCRNQYGTPMVPDGKGGYCLSPLKNYQEVIVTQDSYGNVDWSPKIVGYHPNND